MENFFDKLTNLLSGGNKKQEEEKEKQGAAQAPSLLQAATDAWTGFLNKIQETTKQNIQSGNYTLESEPKTIESPFQSHENLAQKATAKIPQSTKQTEAKSNPWDSNTPFGDKQADALFQKAVKELDAADPNLLSKDLFKDAYDVTSQFVQDVFASDALLPTDDKTRDPFAIAENNWKKALDEKKGEYSALGKSGTELKALLAESGFLSEKQESENQKQARMDKARELAAGSMTPEEKESNESKAAAYDRLNEIVNTAFRTGSVYGLDKADQDIYREMYSDPEGRKLLEEYEKALMAGGDESILKAQAVMDYGKQKAAGLRGGGFSTYEQADEYLNNYYPMYGLAKETGGDMGKISEAYGSLPAIANQIKTKGYDTLTDEQDRAWQDALSAEGLEWLSGYMTGGQALTPDERNQMNAFGQTRQQQIKDVDGLFSQYQMTGEQRGMWNAYIKTPEGAAQWLEDAKGTKDEEAAKNNYYMVSRETKYNEVAKSPAFTETSKAKEDYHSGDFFFDEMYKIINNIGGAADMSRASDDAEEAMYAKYQQLMTDKEKGIFNTYANDGAIDEAKKYINEYLKYSLNERIAEERQTAALAMGESGGLGALGASALSVIGNVVGGALGYVDLMAQTAKNAISGTGQPIDLNTSIQRLTKEAQAGRQGVMNQVNWVVDLPLIGKVDVFDALYNTTMQGVDSVAAAWAGSVLGGTQKAAEAITNIIMSSGAAQNYMQQVYEKGGTSTQAVVGGAVEGFFEYFFEKYSIGAFFDDMSGVGYRGLKDQFKTAAKEALVNAGEEGATQFAQEIADYLNMKDKSDLGEKYNHYLELTGDKDRAKELAVWDLVRDVAEAAASGGLMGAEMGGAANLKANLTTRGIDKTLGNGFSGKTLDSFYSAAEANPEGEAAKLAKKYPKEKATARQAGEIIRAVLTDGKTSAAMKETLRNTARADLALQIAQGTGMIDRDAAGAVTDMIEGRTLTNEQVAAIARNKAGLAITRELFKPEGKTKDAGAASSVGSADTFPSEGKAFGEALEPVEMEAAPGMEMPEPHPSAQALTPSEGFRPASAENQPKGGFSGRSGPPAGGRLDKDVKINVETVMKEDKSKGARKITDITEDKDGGVKVTLSGGETVDLEDTDLSPDMREAARAAARIEDKDAAAALMNAAKEVLGEDAAKAAGEADADAGNAGRDLAIGFVKIYEAAKAGDAKARTLYGEQLDEKTRRIASEAGQRAAERLREQAQERNRQEAGAFGYKTVSEANGAAGVQFDRVGDGLRDKDGKANTAKAVQIKALDLFGKMSKMQIRLVDSLENKANGKYVKGTNIMYISLDAEGGALTKAASHEGFHYISNYSPDMAQKITDFVMDKLGRAEGYDVEQRIKEVQERYRTGAGQELTPEQAREEIVADAMLDVIGTEENLKELMKESRSAVEKITAWISDTYNKFREILNRLAGYSPEIRALKDDVDYIGKIRDMYRQALDAANAARQQALQGYSDVDALRNHPAVQQYIKDMETDLTPEDRENSLTAFLSSLFGDTQKAWIQANMDKWEEGLAKFREALLDYKKNGVALNVALVRHGLDTVNGADIRVASYAAEQVMAAEKERAENAQSNGKQYSLKNQQDAEEKNHESDKAKEDYDYNALVSKADMQITQLDELSDNEFDQIKNDKSRDIAKNIMDTIRKRNGGINQIYNPDTGKNVVIGVKSITHTWNNRNPNKAYLMVASKIDEILKNAIAINELNGSKERSTNYSTIMLGMAETKDYYYAVRMIVTNETLNSINLDNIERIYAFSKEDIQKGGTRLAALGLPTESDSDIPSTMSIADILDIVKDTFKISSAVSKDVASTMGFERPYDPKISKDLRYSLPNAQAQQTDAAESVKDDAEMYAQVKRDEDARAALQMIMRLHEQTTGGGENALIKPGAFEKRLSEMVQKIKEETATVMSDRAIRKGLRTIYQAMEKDGYNPGEILAYAREFYQQILEQSPGVLVEQDETTKEIIQALKNNTFRLTEDQKSEVRDTFGSLADFMRKNYGKMKIRNAARVTLAEVWTETLNPLNPGVFAADVTEANMPDILDAWLETANAKKFAGEFGANIGAMATDGAMNLMLDFYDVPGALKSKSEISADYQEKFENARELVNQYRREARDSVNAARAEYAQKYRERVERDRQTRQEREKKQGVINEIRRAVRPIKTMLIKGTDNRHIPEALRGAMERMIDNLGADRALFSGQEAREIYMKLGKWAADSQLHDAAEAAAYDPDILAKLEWLEQHAGKSKALKDMTMEELQAVRDAAQNMAKLVSGQNEIEAAGRKQKVETLAGSVMDDMQAKKEASGNPFMTLLRKIGFKEMTPVYYAKQVGGTLGGLMMDVIRSESDVAFIIKDAETYINDLIDKYHVNDWIHDKNHLVFTSAAGDRLELTRQMAMTLYAWAERERRNTTQSAAHLRRGGFTYDRYDADVKKMKGVNFTKSHVLAESDIREIGNYLTDEQRAFVADMVKYLSENMAERGNEASMRMFGWKKFGEKWYFPYPTDRNFRGQNSTDAKGQPDKQIKYMSSSHALTENAMNPLKLGNFLDIWAGHVDEMARYSVMAEKLDNLRRVTNYVVGGYVTSSAPDGAPSPQGEGLVVAPQSVKKEIERALGQEGAHYLEQFLRDANGGVQSDDRGFSDKFISLFKKGSVAANLSVVFQQPSAFVRAMSMVNPKYFAKGLHEHGGYRATKERMYANSGVANLKRWGGFDTNTGKGFEDTLLDKVKPESRKDRFMETVDEWTGKGAEKADEITWVYMYSAIEAEIEDRTDLQRGTEEFNRAVAERFDDVMRATQVYDSAFAKSEWMRSTAWHDKIVTSFMAEPTLWINMMMDAAQDVAAKKPGAGRKAARAAGVFIAGTFVNSLLQSIITAFRRKKEEGSTWAEKYISEFHSNFLDALSLEGIASMIPLARDIVSLFQGYDVERADMAVIGNMADAYRKIRQRFSKGETPEFDEWMNLAGMAANAFGIPLRNVYRDLSGIWENTFGGKSSPIGETSWRDIKYSILDNTDWNSFIDLWNGSNTAYYDRMEQALIRGDMAQYEELRGYLEETKGVKTDTVTSGLKKEIKASVTGGLISAEKAADLLTEHFSMTEKDAYFTVDEWQQKAEHAQDEDEYKYSREGALMSAVKAGQDIKEETSKLLDNGYTEKGLKSDIKTQIGKWYRSGEITRQEAEEKIKKYTGETDGDNLYWTIDKWDYMAKTGSDEGYSKYMTLYELIDSGKDTRQEAQRIVTHGVKPESLSSAITAKYKETYVNLYNSGKKAEAADLKAKLLNALEGAGLNRETKNKAIEYWLKDSKK